ncbi:medium-chain acyl-CoA ligase ACSF2, mitochondrial [Melitaea cinxia]|uniref:medium-chain acyl-CoA ligase ACSF2, mitochondrial n=1 Tax=Melitaea cinxia TaxID=113334 RepID=UPI001E26F776|nr:medium-chain acyl-CoA ligase ACSF2, mitochondrial [Melitaea cinxia]
MHGLKSPSGSNILNELERIDLLVILSFIEIFSNGKYKESASCEFSRSFSNILGALFSSECNQDLGAGYAADDAARPQTFAAAATRHWNVRSVRKLQTDQGSYLRNPGSEPLTHATLGDVIAETAHKYPGRVAIRSVHEDLTITYEDLLNQADSLGCALRANGFEKGDRLGIWAHNCAGWIVACVAASRVGLVSVFLNPVYEKNELKFCVNKTKMKGLIIGDSIKNRDYYGMLNKIIPELQTSKEFLLRSQTFPTLTSIISLGKEKLSGVTNIDTLINDFKNNSEVSKYGQELKPEDPSLCLLTSGTTGDPKAAIDSHYNVVNNSYFVGKRLLFQEHQTACLQAPLFHALGSIITMVGPLRHGSTIVIAAPTYNVAANVHALCAEKCTVITGTPTMYVDILSHIKGKSNLPIKLHIALAAGAPCSPELIRQMNKQMNTDFVSALYGLTETTACVFQSQVGDSVDVVAETVGYITDHSEVKVVDEKGEIVPFGTSGELMVKSYSNMIGYFDDPEKTKKTFTEDGWLYTGDKFTISPDGYGKIVGRFKDIIVRGGENIAPKEIEDLLNTHPDIITSQIIGVADERLGEELCAIVKLREGASFTAQEMATYCSGKLARFKIPKLLKTIDEFPRTGSGKIKRYKLKELVESGKL